MGRAATLASALVELVVPSVCPACDLPRRPREPLLCADCARTLEPLERLRAVHTAIAYTGTGMELVRRFKFEGRSDALAVLAARLVVRVERLRFEAIVPVPRHRLRVRSEGSDPVHALASALARATGRPLVAGLEHTRAPRPQTGLSSAARRRNVAGSFRARPRAALQGRRVLLLDDVATTGATLVEAARALRAGGAKRISLCALAATPAMESARGAVL